MRKFPVDAPIRKVVATTPNHPTIKKSTLRAILSQSGISREVFLKAYEE